MNFLPHINLTNCENLKMALKSLDQTIKKHIYCSRSFSRVFLAPLHLVWTKVMSLRLITEAYCLSLITECRTCENDVNKTVKTSGGMYLKWWPCF